MTIIYYYLKTVGKFNNKKLVDNSIQQQKKYQLSKFDLILMNTTFHWRYYATNLLSRDFLELCQKHLNKKCRWLGWGIFHMVYLL